MTESAVIERLQQLYQALDAQGKILSKAKLEGYYRTFRNRFGPDKLASLDGEALLIEMHHASSYDSLTYWLEYKNDDDFPAIFGSIAGGSALKFGIYKRKETDAWMIGSPQKQREISVEEAVKIARNQRDQFIAGAQVLSQFPPDASDENYVFLQSEMDRAAPDLSNTSWAHKYFSLLFPEKLDDYHNPDYQRYNLVKLLQTPPEIDGRYVCAGRFIALARELDIPVNTLSQLLNALHGRPYSYWRIGTRGGSDRQSYWEDMRGGGYVAIGWDDLGDLSWVEYNQDSKNKLTELVGQDYYEGNLRSARTSTQRVFNFLTRVQEGDLVLAADGNKILGIGRVSGSYSHAGNVRFSHRKPVEWLDLSEWELPEREGLQSAVAALKKVKNQLEIERRILGALSLPQILTVSKPGETPKQPGIPGQIQSVLERKKQVILYGPPGTGKTFWALQTARDLASHTHFGRSFSELSETEKMEIIGKDPEGKAALFYQCTFHPMYGYEDFIEGYRPVTTDGQLSFELREGIFKSICSLAGQNPKKSYYLLIDEINRGDIPRIFGELLTMLEKDKRGTMVKLPLSGQSFHVPLNVYIIGTMNTADRSIALLDTALRRRFGFIELMPDISLFANTIIANLPLGPWLEALNRRIIASIGRDARNLQIGHAYFMENGRPVTSPERFVRILREDIVPLLQEYCYEDYDALEKILGKTLVDRVGQRIRQEKLEMNQWDDLVRALLETTPELMASASVVASEVQVPDEEEDTGDDEN